MNEMQLRVEGGYFDVMISQDEEYPGIDIEFIPNADREHAISRPRILFELPKGSNELRALIWNNATSEDYSEEIIFDDWR